MAGTVPRRRSTAGASPAPSPRRRRLPAPAPPPAPALGRAFAFLAASAALSRGVPFLVNVAVARRLTPAQLGVPTVDFALATTVVLTVREGFRRACLRHDMGGAAALSSGWLVMPLGALVAVAVAGGAQAALGAPVMASPYGAALRVVCLAACVELCAEPFHLAATRRGALAVRLAAEGAATCVRAVVLACLVLRRGGSAPETLPLPVELAFGAAQLAGAAALLVAYALAALAAPAQVWPGAPTVPAAPALVLLRDFCGQAAWKLALAEGDKALLLTWRAPAAAGAYGLAANLGGLAARLVLAPLEEAAFGAFAAAAAHGGAAAAQRALCALLSALLLAGLFSAAVGPAFAFLALHTLYGARWANAPGAAAALGAYALLLPLLALNGVSEAYAAARMTPAQLRAANTTLLVAAAAQAAVACALRDRLGAAALMAGNAVAMALRIAAALRFVTASCGAPVAQRSGVRGMLADVLPARGTLLVLLACAAAAAVSDRALRRADAYGTAAAVHVAVGVAAAGAVGVAAATWEKGTLLQACAVLRGVGDGTDVTPQREKQAQKRSL